MIGVRTEFDATDISRRAAAVALCLLVLCACFIRQRYWLMSGGFEPDYLAWANRHYYGGVSDELPRDRRANLPRCMGDSCRRSILQDTPR